MAIKTFINGQENGVITYLGDTEPCAVYVNGKRQDNISYIPDVAEGVGSATYTSEYKNNLRTLQIEGNTVQKESVVQEGILPSEYQEVEYIESTGTQYIDTGFKPNQDTRVVADFQSLDTTLNFLFGARESYSSKAYTTSYYHNEFGVSYGDSANMYIAHIDTNRHTVDFNKNVVSLGTVTYTLPTKTFSCPSNLCLFVCNQNGTNTGYGLSRIFSLKVYDNGTLVRDYTPCYRKSDNVIGLYDLVNGVFYTNAGSGTFLKGQDITPTITPEHPQEIKSCNSSILLSAYQQVEYIESTGTQYIDTGILGKSSLRIVVKTNYAEGALLGTQSNTDTNKSIAIVGANGEYVRFMASGGTQVSANYTSKPPYEIDLSIANFKITSNDGQSYTSPLNGTSTTIDYPMYVFARNIDGQASGFSKRKVYSLKIYDNGTLVRDYIPYYRKSDGAIGLYDLANGVFYTNNGTGTFLKGADISTTTNPTIANPAPITNCGNGQIEVVAKGVNEFDISKVKVTGPYTAYPYISSVTKNSFTITTPKNVSTNGYTESNKKLYELCPNIKIGATYKLVFKKPSNALGLIYLSNAEVSWHSGTTKTITEAMFNSGVIFYGYNGNTYDTPVSVTLSDFMITEAEDAEHEPYFEPTTVSIPANVVLESGANETLLELAKIGDIADTITIDRVSNKVKYTQRICRVRPFVNVGGTLSYAGAMPTHNVFQFALNQSANMGEVSLAKCEFAKVLLTDSEVIGLDANTLGIFFPSKDLVYIYFPISLGITSAQALEYYLTQTGNSGLSIFYVLEEPIEWTITDNMESMGYTVNLKTNLLKWAKNTKNQTNIIEITSTPSVSKTSVNYAKWGGVPNENNT